MKHSTSFRQLASILLMACHSLRHSSAFSLWHFQNLNLLAVRRKLDYHCLTSSFPASTTIWMEPPGNTMDDFSSSPSPSSEERTLSETNTANQLEPQGLPIPKQRARPSLPRKLHTLTVAMVPPPNYKDVWTRVGAMRVELRDPGYYRWPPHVNLLYPFTEYGDATETSSSGPSLESQPFKRTECDNNEKDKRNKDMPKLMSLPEVVKQLHSATRQCPPFSVKLNKFGTFGGKNRGVLWLYPDSSFETLEETPEEKQLLEDKKSKYDDSTSTTPKGKYLPLMTLQRRLEDAFPSCNDLSQKGNDGLFHPHMTLSHFETLTDALEAQSRLEVAGCFGLEDLNFVVDRVYLLERRGDGGQFQPLAEIGLGSESTYKLLLEDPSSRLFPDMPLTEADWVYQERMALKARRNNNGWSRRGRRGRKPSSFSRKPRIPDTPEIIAAKRAARKAKREALEAVEAAKAETDTQ